MDYNVIITPVAEHHLDMYIAYTLFVLKNEKAANDILNDAEETEERLKNGKIFKVKATPTEK